MKSKVKFTKEYRKKLEGNIKNLIPYLEARTGYKIKMSVVLDETHGFIYAVQLSADNFQTYSKFTIFNSTKSAVKQEIVKSVHT